MALSTYNVKYRHDYRNNEGTQFRLEILKDAYAGSVIEVTGQAEPCSIVWNGNDDIETPIVGSIAEINLYQLDGEDLSELYTADREEFFVKLSYFDTSDYQLYWKGFIIQDEYVQSITSDPSPINIKATDGLGSLGDFDVGEGFQVISADENLTPFDIILGAINEGGLEFDFVDVTDMRRDDVANYTTSSIFVQYEFRSENLLRNIDGVDSYHSFKDALETVMKSFNCRLFQANGKLYAWNIMSLRQSTIGLNFTHTFTFLSASWSHSTLTIDKLTIPTDLRPIGDNMEFVSIDPILSYNRSYKVSPQNLIYNSFFILNDNGWTDNGNIAISATNAQKGNKSGFFEDESNVDDSVFNAASEVAKNTTYRILQTETSNGNATDTFDHTFEEDVKLNGVFSFYYYVTENQQIRYSIQRGSSTEYYNPDTGLLQTSFVYRIIDTSIVNRWVKESITISIGSTFASVGAKGLTFRIHSPDEEGGGGSGTSTINFDNFSFTIEPNLLLQTEYELTTRYLNNNTLGVDTALKIKKQDLLFGAQNVIIQNGIAFSEFELINNTLGQYTKPGTPDEIIKVDYSPRELDTFYLSKYLEDWCLTQLAVIYAEPPKRYTSTLSDRRAIGTEPMSLVNVIDIDSSIFTEPNVIGITRLTVNTRSNIIEFTGLSLEGLAVTGVTPTTVNREFNTTNKGD